jgi:serine/threonine-protein kinase PknG
VKCQRPGCTGVIEDGYCNRCGMAPANGHTAASRPSGTGSTRTTSSRRDGTRTRTTGRSHLGAGLVDVPPVPYRDPSTAVLADPEVSEDKRFCGHCGQPVGRSHGEAPGRSEGFCRKCGHPYSFVPKLVAGQLVAGQYDVVGCLAHGGLGWIYLARDRNVSDRWVVLKGLLDSGDRDAMSAAVAERRFLAEVEHPNIVKIFNFVQDKDAGYIVMEYVGGSSLKDLLKRRREAALGRPDPIPVAQAIAYLVEILPALGYLHKLGLVFCDFKPDNVIQTDETLKLIDMGGVRRIDDEASPVYGTVGYQAPEIAGAGPSVPSDLFTVARTLAVLTIDFKGYQSTYQYTLPGPGDIAIFARYDSLYRLLMRATATNPDDRFQSADDMVEQLLGVLREVVAAEEGVPHPAPSSLFTGDLRDRTDAPSWRSLPSLRVGADDPAAGFLATIGATGSSDLVRVLSNAPVHTTEVDLRLTRALIDSGDRAGAQRVLDGIQAADQWEWRTLWYRGLMALATGNPGEALTRFDAVYRCIPGELAPKLALAVAAESAGDRAGAARWYDVVSRTDPSFTTAAFGLARCRVGTGDRAGAVEAYNRVPETSSAYLEAQVGAARALVESNGASGPDMTDLTAACAAIDKLALDGEQRASLTRDLLQAALNLVRTGRVRPDPQVTVLGEPLTERRLREGLERAYRALAHLAPTADERIRLVDLANQVRPRTLV